VGETAVFPLTVAPHRACPSDFIWTLFACTLDGAPRDPRVLCGLTGPKISQGRQRAHRAQRTLRVHSRRVHVDPAGW